MKCAPRYMLGHNTNLSTFQKMKVLQAMFSDINSSKLGNKDSFKILKYLQIKHFKNESREKVTREKKYSQFNNNESTTYQDLDSAKLMLRGILDVYMRREERLKNQLSKFPP